MPGLAEIFRQVERYNACATKSVVIELDDIEYIDKMVNSRVFPAETKLRRIDDVGINYFH